MHIGELEEVRYMIKELNDSIENSLKELFNTVEKCMEGS